MIDTIYVEDQVKRHPRVREICARFESARVISCQHYGEIFNRHNQNFKLQKARPALILAAKLNRRVLPIPAGYGINGARGYYFSHLLNCLYDCRYCFLQGMFRSAHYVWFVNYEDFIDDIRMTCNGANGDTWFFSGYDCDSLALDPVARPGDGFHYAIHTPVGPDRRRVAGIAYKKHPNPCPARHAARTALGVCVQSESTSGHYGLRTQNAGP